MPNPDEMHSGITDGNLFLITIVPLKIVINDNNTNWWTNPKPSSTQLCRPLKFLYKEETSELTKEEVSSIEPEIVMLEPFKVIKNGKHISLNYSIHLSMIDGKVINELTGTSSQTCYICKCKPSQMNNLSNIKNIKNDKTVYKCGLTTCLDKVFRIHFE